MYTNIGDCPDLEKFADLVTVNLRHDFTPAELAQESQMLAQSVNDKQHEENYKKVAMTAFKNKIDTLDADIKLHASNLTHGFTYRDVTTEMYRDWKAAKRVYFDKQTGNFVKEEVFHQSDFQKKLDFELEESGQQQQIEENNSAGDFANGGDALDQVIRHKAKAGKKSKFEIKPVDELGYDRHGNLTDINPVE